MQFFGRCGLRGTDERKRGKTSENKSPIDRLHLGFHSSSPLPSPHIALFCRWCCGVAGGGPRIGVRFRTYVAVRTDHLVTRSELVFSFRRDKTLNGLSPNSSRSCAVSRRGGTAILNAAREAASEGGMAAVQIAPVATRANVAAGTVYRYFPSKADLISELIADVSHDELTAIRRAADAAPGPSSALAAAVTTIAVHVVSHRKLAWGILAEPVDVDVTKSRLASRRAIAAEIKLRIDAAVRAGHLPAQDTELAATSCSAPCMKPWSARSRRPISTTGPGCATWCRP